jgi:hypothetical protein
MSERRPFINFLSSLMGILWGNNINFFRGEFHFLEYRWIHIATAPRLASRETS